MKLIKSVSAVFLTLLLIQPSFAADSPKEPPVYPFVEIVYEFNTQPLKDQPLEVRSTPEDLNGYFLRRSPDLLRPKLYPAMGKPFTEPAKETMFIGYKVQNLTDHSFRDYQTLETLADKGALSIDTGKEPSVALSFQSLGLFGVVRPGIPVSVKRENEDELKIAAGGKAIVVKQGETKEIFSKEEKHTPEEWLKIYTEIMKKLGAEESALELDHLRNDFTAMSPEGEPVTLYVRISAVHYGNVNVMNLDILNEWKTAEEKLSKGPYEEAKASLKNVLAAAPEHRNALRLYDQLISMEKEGKKPSQLRGKIVFPAGLPDKKLKDFWNEYSEGLAAIGLENASEDQTIAVTPVKDGAFALMIPSGKYQLTVSVPGFSIYRQKVTVEGTTNVDVQLQAV